MNQNTSEATKEIGIPFERGYIQLYTGDGKGKTTAAIGLAVRAVGAGLRVFIGQFIKQGRLRKPKPSSASEIGSSAGNTGRAAGSEERRQTTMRCSRSRGSRRYAAYFNRANIRS